MQKQKIVVQGKRGGFSVPAKLLMSPQKPKQELLYKEYWESPAQYVFKVWEGK